MSPAWRAGAWLLGVDVLLTLPSLLFEVPFSRSTTTVGWFLLWAILSLVLTAPHALARHRGEGDYRAPMVVVMRPLAGLWWFFYAIVARLPEYLGDTLLTSFWNRFAPDRALSVVEKRGRGRGARSAVREEPLFPWSRRR